MTRTIVFIGMLFIIQTALAQEIDIPVLNWEPRSDWMNVMDFGAKGDGVSDDTAAIQAVFALTPETDTNYLETLSHRVVYFPPGHYRRLRDDLRFHD